MHHLTPSRYVLFLLALLLLLGNYAAVHAQAINLCQIAFLKFNYPNPVPPNQPVTVITSVVLFSCPAGPISARVDLFDSQQNLISTGYNSVDSARVDVTNTIIAPPTSGQYLVYAAAYMIIFGAVAGSYRSSFELTVVPQDQITTSSISLTQNISQTTSSLVSVTSNTVQNSSTSAESILGTFAPTISNQELSPFTLSSDVLYDLVIALAVFFIVSLTILSLRRRKR